MSKTNYVVAEEPATDLAVLETMVGRAGRVHHQE